MTLCPLAALEEHSGYAWKLLRLILSSVNAYSALRLLQEMLSELPSNPANKVPHHKLVVILRGAVFTVSMALWGAQKVETLRCSPSVILPTLAVGMSFDPLVGKEALVGVRRLVGKYGKSLQQLTWTFVFQFLEAAVKIVKQDPIAHGEMSYDLHRTINAIEGLYESKQYDGSSEALFQLVEHCIEDRPEDSALALIEYRIAGLDPLSPKWLSQLTHVIGKFIGPHNSPRRREKAISVVHETYRRYRLLYEQEVVKKLILEFCSNIASEENAAIQYQLINIIFDVAKSVSLKVTGENDIFAEVMHVIRTLFNEHVAKLVHNDNLEIVACNIGDVLNERWKCLDLPLLGTIFDMITEHLKIQYSLGYVDSLGADVRIRIFESLLLVHCHPITGQLVRVVVVSSPSQLLHVANSRIIRAGDDTNGEFSWSAICDMTTQAWPVLKRILECLSGVLEFRRLVYTAGQYAVSQLVSAILHLYARNRSGELNAVDGELPKFICPVLGKLVNYTRDAQLCRILVDCAASGSIQAIMACDLAVQVLPDKMAIVNRQLMDVLVHLRPSAQLAIPIIELVSDSADCDVFHEFFQEKHFKSVIDVLAPYCNAHAFNMFIIAVVHRTVMRWFVRVPEPLREEIAQYVIRKFSAVNEKAFQRHRTRTLTLTNNEAATTPPQINKGMKCLDRQEPPSNTPPKTTSVQQMETPMFTTMPTVSHGNGMGSRQPSGDGRQLTSTPYDETAPLFSIGPPTISPDSSPSADMQRSLQGRMRETDNTAEHSPTANDEQNRRSSDASGLRNTLHVTSSVSSDDRLAMGVSNEVLDALSIFMRYWRRRSFANEIALSSSSGEEAPLVAGGETVVEKRVENWIIDRTVFTVRILTKTEECEANGSHARRMATISIDRPSTTGMSRSAKAGAAARAVAAATRLQSIDNGVSKDDTALGASNANNSGGISAFSSSISGRSDNFRRRHQSAIQGPTQRHLLGFSIEWVQLVVRHLYGKETWLTRSLDRIPDDFDSVSSLPVSDPSSLILHLRGNHGAIRIPPKDNDSVARALRILDRVSPEEFHAVGVLYIGEEQSTEQQILSNQYGSERYAKFLRQLGRVISLDSHPGGLTAERHGKFTYEYRDAIARIVFQVATLMPSSENDPKCNAKKSLIGNNFVSIVFNESGVPYKLGTVSGQFDHVALEVVPHDEETVVITLHARREIACWLAMTRAFLPDEQAVRVLRKMAIRAQLSVNVWRSLEDRRRNDRAAPYLSQAIDRLRRIDSLTEKGLEEE
ncbi:rap/ran-GAP family protein [Aphelenchoides avenae]|nr:rap/ran-GAP family protein [Aphelenchus avenae]